MNFRHALFAIFVLHSAILFGQISAQGDDDCKTCLNVTLSSQGGIAIDLGRYMGTWSRQGTWQDKAFYTCSNCQGLFDQLIWYQNNWVIVDCTPDDAALCQGVHDMITSPPADISTCPEDMAGSPTAPFTYCDGSKLPGGGCQVYGTDPTAAFSCA